LLGVEIKKTLWDMLAAFKRPPSIAAGRMSCLYALHLQPESAIDVYGMRWNDQTILIDKLSGICTTLGFLLLVKANPKFNLEVTLELITLAMKVPNIYLLPRKMPMSSALSSSNVVVSVTGTVLMECILSGKPAVALADSPISRHRGCIVASSESEISKALHRVARGEAETSTKEEKIQYLMRMARNSYRGKISDPLNDPACLEAENILAVASAFRTIVNSLSVA